jgi:MazG family protein
MDAAEAFARLVAVVARLRGPDGCPWDRAQTLETVRPHLLEETYEVLEALEGGTPAAHREELGDLLLQVVFQARLREEAGEFDVGAVANGIADKLVRRHPHVFGGDPRPDGTHARWGELKAREGRESAVDGVPAALPALLRAARIGEKAAGVGFDWRAPDDVFAKLAEEAAELRAAMAAGERAEVEAELGDYLFTVVNLARKVGVDPESALRGTVRRFEQRFRRMEADARAEGKPLNSLDDDELERRWQAAKKALRDQSSDPSSASAAE